MVVEDVLDREELMLRVDDDVELLQELIELFLEDYPALMSEIEAGIREQDAKKLKRGAHTLKGSVGNFCASRAFNAAFQLEAFGSKEDFSQTEAAYTSLVEEMKAVEQALQLLAEEHADG